MNQLNQRPIIALDFSTWQEVEDFSFFFPRRRKKLFVKNRKWNCSTKKDLKSHVI